MVRSWNARRTSAALTAALFGVLFLLYPEDAPLADGLDEFFLIGGSLAIGVLFLPTVGADLWDLQAEVVAETVPEHRQDHLLREVITARTHDARLRQMLFDGALRGALDATPAEVVTDFDYVAKVYAHDVEPATDLLPPRRRVRSELTSTRVLRGPQRGPTRFWISIARSEAALAAEYRQPGCLLRDLVPLARSRAEPLDDATWASHIVSSASVSAALPERTGGDDAVAVVLAGSDEHAELPDRTDVVRWYLRHPALDDAAATGRPVRTSLAMEFRTDDRFDRFHVAMASYWAIGRTRLTFELVDPHDEYELETEAFLGTADMLSDRMVVERDDAIIRTTVTTPDNTVLWPGSGMMVTWRRSTSGEG